MQVSDGVQTADFGVLFVSGIGKQRPGRSIVAFAGALYGWLFRSNHAECLSAQRSPRLTDVTLSASETDGPSHSTLEASLYLDGSWHPARWLLAESSWADASDLPQFMHLARWIWKVSTCLLVLQFVIPMRRHWEPVKRAFSSGKGTSPDSGDDEPGWLPSCAALAGYLILMGIAAMLSVILSLVLVLLAIVAWLPIPRIDDAVHWVIIKLSSILGDSYLLAHCPVQYAAMRTRFAHDLQWLQSQCRTVAVVAHSQGAAIAHQVLRDSECSTAGVKAFITIGQGIAKLHLLQRMDWDPIVQEDVLLPAAESHLRWTDYYDCKEVFNRGSLLTDHNSYLGNHEEFVSYLLNDLVAVACADTETGQPGPALVSDCELRAAKRSRKNMLDWLIVQRVLAGAVGVLTWLLVPTDFLHSSMNGLAHLGGSHVGIGGLVARLSGVVLAMGAWYLLLGILVWRIWQGRTRSKFFDARPPVNAMLGKEVATGQLPPMAPASAG